MAGRFSTVRDLLRHVVADSPSISKTVAQGRRAAMHGESTHSLFGGAARWLAGKAKGKEKVSDFLYEKIHRPLKNVDEKSGKVLADAFGAPKLFRQVDVLPTSRKIDGNRAFIEHETHSATAPIAKAMKAVTPIAAAIGVQKMTEALSGNGEDQMAEEKQAQPIEDKDALLKEASVGLRQAHRRVEAEKLAFALVEKQKIQPFGSYGQFQEKVAEILSKDLAVVKEALAMDGQLADFGKVAEERPGVGANTDQATAQFFHTLAD